MDMLFFLQDAATGAAPAAGAPPAGGAAGGIAQMLPMFGLMFVVMYFLMIRPQNKQRKERDAMIANLKKNDHVITNGGLYGIIKQVKADDPDVTLMIDERKDVCIRVTKVSIAGLVKASGAPADAEPKADAAEKKT